MPASDSAGAGGTSIKQIQKNSLLRRRSSLGKDAAEFNMRQKDLGLHQSAWQTDAEATQCMECRKKFGINRRKHHCRECGFVYCNKCSAFQVVINGQLKRACLDCYQQAVNRTNIKEPNSSPLPGSFSDMIADNNKTPQSSGTLLLGSKLHSSFPIVHSGESKPEPLSADFRENALFTGDNSTKWFETIVFYRRFGNGTILSCNYPPKALSDEMREDILSTMASITEKQLYGKMLFRVRDKDAPGIPFKDDNDEVVGTAITNATEFSNCFASISSFSLPMAAEGASSATATALSFTQCIVLVSKWPFQQLAYDMLDRIQEAMDLQGQPMQWRMLSCISSGGPILHGQSQDEHRTDPQRSMSTEYATNSDKFTTPTRSSSVGASSGGKLNFSADNASDFGEEEDATFDHSVASSVLEVAYSQITNWPQIIPASLAYLTFFGDMLHCIVPPEVSPQDINPRMTSLLLRLNLVEVLAPLGLVQHLWAIWEMVITGQDIVVVATNPMHVSEIVLALASLLEPMGYAGDVRPFMRGDDKDLYVLTATAQLKVMQRHESDLAAEAVPVTDTMRKLAARRRSMIVGVCDPDALMALDDFSTAIFVDSTDYVVQQDLKHRALLLQHQMHVRNAHQEDVRGMDLSGHNNTLMKEYLDLLSEEAFQHIRKRNAADTQHVLVSYTGDPLPVVSVITGKPMRGGLASFLNRKSSRKKMNLDGHNSFYGLYQRWLEMRSKSPSESESKHSQAHGGSSKAHVSAKLRTWLVFKSKPEAIPLRWILKRIHRLDPSDRLVFGDKILRDNLLDITRAFLGSSTSNSANPAASLSDASLLESPANLGRASQTRTSFANSSIEDIQDDVDAALELLSRKRSLAIAREAERKGMWREAGDDIWQWIRQLPHWILHNISTVLLWMLYLCCFALLAWCGLPPVLIVIVAFLIKIPERAPPSWRRFLGDFAPTLKGSESSPSLALGDASSNVNSGSVTPVLPSVSPPNVLTAETQAADFTNSKSSPSVSAVGATTGSSAGATASHQPQVHVPRQHSIMDEDENGNYVGDESKLISHGNSSSGSGDEEENQMLRQQLAEEKPDLSGVWKRTKAENLEAFLGAQGENYMLCKVEASVAMLHTITMNRQGTLFRLEENGGTVVSDVVYEVVQPCVTTETKVKHTTYLDTVQWDDSYQTESEIATRRKTWKLLITRVRVPDRRYELRIWRWFPREGQQRIMRMRAVCHSLKGNKADVEAFCTFEYVQASPHRFPEADDVEDDSDSDDDQVSVYSSSSSEDERERAEHRKSVVLATRRSFSSLPLSRSSSRGGGNGDDSSKSSRHTSHKSITPRSRLSGLFNSSRDSQDSHHHHHRHSASNHGLVDFSGVWLRTRTENFEAFIAATGASFLQRKLAAQMSLVHTITMNAPHIKAVRLQEKGGPLNTDFTMTLYSDRDVAVMISGKRLLHRAWYSGPGTFVVSRRAEDGSFEHLLTRTLDTASSAGQPQLILRSLYKDLKTGKEVEAVSFFSKTGASPNPPPIPDPHVAGKMFQAILGSDEH